MDVPRWHLLCLLSLLVLSFVLTSWFVRGRVYSSVGAGTPISYTEVTAFRRYATNGTVDDFARFDDFLPHQEFDGDVTYTLTAGATYTASYNAGTALQQHEQVGNGEEVAPLGDGLFETTFWAAWPGDGNMTMVVRASPINGAESPAEPESAETSTNSQSHVAGSCSQETDKVYHGTDIAGADFKGIDYRTLDVTKEAIAHNDSGVSTCSAACCAWDGCAAWIVQSGTGPSVHDGNCTKDTTTCCWLKPNGAGARVRNSKSIAGVVTASPSRPIIPPPPPPPPAGLPSPHNVSGYHVVLIGATKTLAVERRDPQGGIKLLGAFDLSTLENGLVLEAWNILRTVVETLESNSGAIEGVQVSVWFNPCVTGDLSVLSHELLCVATSPSLLITVYVALRMLPETGFVGNSSDASRVPRKLPARLVVKDKDPLGPGEMIVTAGARDTMIDYIAAMPTSVM